jgi:hypothetical protein
MKLNKFESNWGIFLAFFALVYAGYYATMYASQPILESHAFRQTQTALTAFWFQKEGWKLAYETPVGGYPWSIPFEFPLYQYIVAFFSDFLKLPITATGRMVSFAFLVLCYFPIKQICSRLRLDHNFKWIFCAFLWTSPIYVFWSRTFMIETTALFLTISAIPFALDFLSDKIKLRSLFYLILFASLALLQKITTAFPVIFVLIPVIIISHLKLSSFADRNQLILNYNLALPSRKKIFYCILGFGLPLLFGLFWVKFTNDIKIQNNLGELFTSKFTSKWIFGTLQQKLDFSVYKLIIWDRVIKSHFGGFGLLIIFMGLIKAEKKIRGWIIVSLILFVLPFFIFTNLHFVHDYYQVSSTIFLLFAFAISILLVLPRFFKGSFLTSLFVLFFLGQNIISFNSHKQLLKMEFNDHNTEVLKLSKFLKEKTDPNSSIIVFGDDWNSRTAFYSERKSFTVPYFYKNYFQVLNSSEKFKGDRPLGAVVFYLDDKKINLDLIQSLPYINNPLSLLKISEKTYVWIPPVN